MLLTAISEGIEVLDLHINGAVRNVDAAPDSKVVYVLRHDLRLSGVRMGCGEGHCGVCTVLVDGRPATTCDLPLWAVQGKSVVTPEGVGSPERPHPVQAALLEEQAGQCGFCLSGILMTAVSLVDRERASSEQEVRAALDRHLCRCGTQHRILKAVMKAVRQVHPS